MPSMKVHQSSTGKSQLWTVAMWLVLACVAGGLVANHFYPEFFQKAYAEARSQKGFIAAFTLIFVSELGDKTFFIAGLLAAKLGRVLSFVGTMIALSMMTVISVVIGVVFSKVPASISQSIPIGQYLAAALFVIFGAISIRDGLKKDEDEAIDELGEAEKAMQDAEKQGRVGGAKSFMASKLAQVVSLIFIAEWGDRSMIATIALGAASSPLGVTVGAIVGHAVATVIAVVGGALAAEYLSEKVISLIGGTCFLIFAVVTAIWG